LASSSRFGLRSATTAFDMIGYQRGWNFSNPAVTQITPTMRPITAATKYSLTRPRVNRLLAMF